MSKSQVKTAIFLCKVEKEKKSSKKLKKGVDIWVQIWYYNWAPLREGSEKRTLKIKQRQKKGPDNSSFKLGKTDKNKTLVLFV